MWTKHSIPGSNNERDPVSNSGPDRFTHATTVIVTNDGKPNSRAYAEPYTTADSRNSGSNS